MRSQENSNKQRAETRRAQNSKCLKVLFFLIISLFGCIELDSDSSTTGENTSEEPSSWEPEEEEPPVPELTHVATWELPEGTHRPEILVTDDAEILIGVVVPGGGTNSEGQIKHSVYRFDSSFNQIGEPFPITYTTSDYGQPADHRMTLVDGELVITYQTLLYGDDGGASCMGGPMEPCAESQSLFLTRYSLNGEELFRTPIVAHATDFSEDSFPDHCILWQGDRLLVSTGVTGGWGEAVKFREVDLEGNILATHTVTVSGNSIGNSLLDDGSRIRLFSDSGLPDSAITSVEVDPYFDPTNLTTFEDESREQTFPTGNLFYNGFAYVGSISRSQGGPPGLEENPYSPSLKILDADQNVIDDFQIGEVGFSHTHPTLARIGNRLFYAWSKQVDGENGNGMPQVHVEEYEIQ